MCKSCAIAKTKQKNTTQESTGRGKSTMYNDKMYSDLSFVYGPNKKQETRLQVCIASDGG